MSKQTPAGRRPARSPRARPTPGRRQGDRRQAAAPAGTDGARPWNSPAAGCSAPSARRARPGWSSAGPAAPSGSSAAREGDAPRPLTTIGSTEVAVPRGACRAAGGHHHPVAGQRPSRRLRPGAGRGPQGRGRTAAPLVADGRGADGRARTPDADTGVALDAGPSSLTVTFGFGHSFFGRTGLQKRRPVQLDPLPDFSADALDPGRSNGDLWIQIGADDALVAFHALRALQKDAAGSARLRWQMNGFNRTPGATARPMTTRNLMGQIDGTNNPKPSDQDFDERIFVGRDTDQEWMRGGSYAVVRRIRMLLDDWEKRSRREQEQVIGRRKDNGAPLTGGSETTPMRLDETGADGLPVIPANAHARIAAPESNQGAAMLRRPFSFHDGFRDDGAPDAGLLFICWQADPLRAFTQIQRKLDRGDALSPFLRHEASGLYAVPPGRGAGRLRGPSAAGGLSARRPRTVRGAGSRGPASAWIG